MCDWCNGHTYAMDPPIECRICTKPLAPSEVDDHIAAAHGYGADLGETT